MRVCKKLKIEVCEKILCSFILWTIVWWKRYLFETSSNDQSRLINMKKMYFSIFLIATFHRSIFYFSYEEAFNLLKICPDCSWIKLQWWMLNITYYFESNKLNSLLQAYSCWTGNQCYHIKKFLSLFHLYDVVFCSALLNHLLKMIL